MSKQKVRWVVGTIGPGYRRLSRRFVSQKKAERQKREWNKRYGYARLWAEIEDEPRQQMREWVSRIKSSRLVVDTGFCRNKRTGARRIFREMGDGKMQIRKPMHVGNNPHDPSRLIGTISRRMFHEKYDFEARILGLETMRIKI